MFLYSKLRQLSERGCKNARARFAKRRRKWPGKKSEARRALESRQQRARAIREVGPDYQGKTFGAPESPAPTNLLSAEPREPGYASRTNEESVQLADFEESWANISSTPSDMLAVVSSDVDNVSYHSVVHLRIIDD